MLFHLDMWTSKHIKVVCPMRARPPELPLKHGKPLPRWKLEDEIPWRRIGHQHPIAGDQTSAGGTQFQEEGARRDPKHGGEADHRTKNVQAQGLKEITRSRLDGHLSST